MSTFTKSLSEGEIVLSYSHLGRKIHLVTLGKSKHDLEGKKKDRADPDLRLWSGRTLCDQTGGGYYFSPRDEIPESEKARCAPCWRKWRGLDRPPVHGWNGEEPAAPAWPIPFGWREETIAGHPWDVALGGDPEVIHDGTGKSVGEIRAERRRWQRGDRVVRLVEYPEKVFGALYSNMRDPLEEQWQRKGPEALCLRECWEIMAKGGTP